MGLKAKWDALKIPMVTEEKNLLAQLERDFKGRLPTLPTLLGNSTAQPQAILDAVSSLLEKGYISLHGEAKPEDIREHLAFYETVAGPLQPHAMRENVLYSSTNVIKSDGGVLVTDNPVAVNFALASMGEQSQKYSNTSIGITLLGKAANYLARREPSI